MKRSFFSEGVARIVSREDGYWVLRSCARTHREAGWPLLLVEAHLIVVGLPGRHGGLGSAAVRLLRSILDRDRRGFQEMKRACRVCETCAVYTCGLQNAVCERCKIYGGVIGATVPWGGGWGMCCLSAATATCFIHRRKHKPRCCVTSIQRHRKGRGGEGGCEVE